MSHTVKVTIVTALLLLLASCSAKTETSYEPAGLSFKATEILVRQCSDINNIEFNALLEQHDLTIKKQISPHLYVVTWHDDRHADKVVQILKSTAMFCGVDKYQE